MSRGIWALCETLKAMRVCLVTLTLVTLLVQNLQAQSPQPEVPDESPAQPRGLPVGGPSQAADLQFLYAMPGFLRRQQLSESQHFYYQLGKSGLMPWIQCLKERGCRLRATPERLMARQGDLYFLGSVRGKELDLKVGPPHAFQSDVKGWWGQFPWPDPSKP